MQLCCAANNFYKLTCILQNLTLYSLGDIRDILILVHYFFTGKIEDLFHEPLIEYTGNLSKSFLRIINLF
ncbi:hypothetical protein EfmGK941_00920 [Enterococcus faecium]|nr:hypothetical protein EfmGK941_00920 [Enterococcus faecium]